MSQSDIETAIYFKKSFIETFNYDKTVEFTNLDCECNDEINFTASFTLVYNNIKYKCVSDIEFDEEGGIVETDISIENQDKLSEILNDKDDELEGTISDYLTSLALDLFEVQNSDSDSDSE